MAERTSDRRTFVSSSVAAGMLGTFVFDSSFPLIARADGGAVDYTAVAADIADLVRWRIVVIYRLIFSHVVSTV